MLDDLESRVPDTRRRCKVCGDFVPADRSRARAGMTIKHHISIEQSDTRPLCKGSKIRHEDQPLRTDPWIPPGAPPIPNEWPPADAPTRRSPFHETLAKLRGRGTLTRVDFLEARVQRSLGHVTARAHARRFIRVEIRDA